MAQARRRPPAQPRREAGDPTVKPVAVEAQARQTAADRRAERAAQARRDRQQRQRRNLIFAAIGAVALVLVAVFFLNRQSVAQANAGTAIPDEGRGHVTTDTQLTYNHYPPSSGKHYDTPAAPGVYRQEVPIGNWVHSLEHGYIVALVKCSTNCDSLYQQFDDLYKNGLPKSQFGNVKFVVTPYSGPFSDGEAPITLVAWDYEMKLQGFDRDKIAGFYKVHVDKGPELVQ